MFSGSRIPFLFVAVLVLVPLVAAGQWPADPAVNLPLADGPMQQVVPHLSPTSDGGCYVGWYDTPGLGEYRVLLQRLSPSGEELFPHNGLVVSDHPSDTWVMDWALLTDRNDNAIVAFTDIRGGDFDLYIYKIDPAGNFLWGLDGIALTSNGQYWGFPGVCEAANGDIVVVWSEGNNNTRVMMQRISPAGELLLGAGGVDVSQQSGQLAYAARPVPADGDNVIVAWSPDCALDTDRQIAARKFSASGAALWADPVAVMDTGTMPMGSYFDIQPDGQGGAVMVWTMTEGFSFSVMAQHLDGAGQELLPHNGLNLFPASESEHIYPTLNHDPATGETWVFCRSQNTDQNRWGLDGQIIGAEGILLWGETGRDLFRLDPLWRSLPRAALTGDGRAMVFQVTGASFPPDQDTVVAALISGEGTFVWEDKTVTLATTPSDKLNMWAAMSPVQQAFVVWEDRRNDAGDIFGQNVRLDGSLGTGLSGTPELPPVALALKAVPNPFNPQTVITYQLPAATPVSVSVCDLKGRRVATLWDGVQPEGEHQVRWNGTSHDQRAMPSGTYLVELKTRFGVQHQKVTLAR